MYTFVIVEKSNLSKNQITDNKNEEEIEAINVNKTTVSSEMYNNSDDKANGAKIVNANNYSTVQTYEWQDENVYKSYYTFNMNYDLVKLLILIIVIMNKIVVNWIMIHC